MMFPLHIAIYICGGLFVAYYFLSIVKLLISDPLKDIPGPTVARYSGLYRIFLVYKGKLPEELRSLHEKYGKIVRISPDTISISDPSLIPEIYGLGSKYLKVPYDGVKMDSMFTTRDPVYHKNLKTPVAQLFSMTNMRNFEQYADECTGIFLKSMNDLQGQSIDLAAWLQWYAFDVIASITFQRRFGFMERREDVDQMVGGLDKGVVYVGLIGQFPSLHPYLMGNRLLMATLAKIIPNLPDPLFNLMERTKVEVQRYDSEEKNTGRTDFLSQLRAKEAKDGKIPLQDMMNHLSNNIIAGSDTTAIALRACFYYLMKNPTTYQKVVNEIDNADRNGMLSDYITYEQCLKLTYLQAAMKEAMRLHPSVGFPLERLVPNAGAKLGGYSIPPSTIVSVSAPVVHVDKDVFGVDAMAFRPERWLEADPETVKVMDRSLLTFGYGARTCIGKNISIMEMGKFIPNILRHFDLQFADPNQEWQTYAAWFWKQFNFNVRIIPRNKV